MPEFEQPEILAEFDRSYGDRHEKLVLERGQYQGRPTFTIRMLWRAPDGVWRWSAPKPTSTGRVWAAIGVKARELKALGLALVEAADALEKQGGPMAVPRPARKPNAAHERERARFEREHPPTTRNDDDGGPF